MSSVAENTRRIMDTLVLNASDRMSEFAESTEKYRAGERNIGEQALMGASTAVAGVADIPGTLIMEAVPEPVQKGLQQVIAGVMNTGPAKAYMKWREGNPRAAENVERSLGLGVELAGAGYLTKAPKAGVDALARNMPNELTGFYGSGKVGQLGSVVKAAPMGVVDATKELMFPKAQAKTRGGVNPAIERASARNLKEGGDLSFIEGQMDQTKLLNEGAGRSGEFIDDAFGKLQVLDTGDLNDQTMAKAFTSYKPEQYTDIRVDSELISNMTQRVKAAQGLPDDARVVIRHPTALTDLYPESTTRGGNAARRMYKARASLAKHFPDQKGFGSQEDMVEFIGTKNLVDSRPVRVDGKPMTKADHARVRAVGLGDTYKPKESGLANIDKYYELKAKIASGKKLTKPQQAKWETLRGRVERGMKDVEFDSQGRAYFSDSHRSAAKGLGGVNNQYVVDKDGNVMHYINDENDLFGQKVPGDRNVVSVTPPSVYNIWNIKGKSAPDVAGKEAKESVGMMMQDKYGAEYKGTSRQALRRQLGEAAINYDPKVELQDYRRPAANVAAAGGLLTSIGSQEEPTQ